MFPYVSNLSIYQDFGCQPSMPGNGLEDRIHNFFAQDSSFLGQHHSQAMEGNWTVPNSNFWAGSHRQDNSVNSNNITYNSQISGTYDVTP